MIDRLKPMLATYGEEAPVGKDWGYECKYDGFRCIVYLDKDKINLISRNGKELKEAFPEIVSELETLRGNIQVPFVVDGEIAVLTNPYKASFEHIQMRGRTKKDSKIKELTQAFPATFLAFDLLQYEKEVLANEPFLRRKQILKEVMKKADLPTKVDPNLTSRCQFIPFITTKQEMEEIVSEYDSEGMVAKQFQSKWVPGQRTTNWIKVKNWKYACFFIIAYEKGNGFFHVGLVKGGEIVPVGLFTNGLSEGERDALFQIVKRNQTKETNELIMVKPSICVELRFLEWYKDGIRHPQFVSFLFQQNWEDCTWEAAHSNKMGK